MLNRKEAGVAKRSHSSTFAALSLILTSGCNSQGIKVKEWQLGIREPLFEHNVVLPTTLDRSILSQADHYRLRSRVKVPHAWGGQMLRLSVPYFVGNVRMVRPEDNAVVSSSTSRLAGPDAYRQMGPKTWVIAPSAVSDGHLELELLVDYRFTRAGWWDSVPVLGPAAVPDPHTQMIQVIGFGGGAFCVVGLLTLGLMYLSIFWVDRTRWANFFFAIQAFGASYYGLWYLGPPQYVLGIFDLKLVYVSLFWAPVAAVWFTHKHFRLPRPSMIWIQTTTAATVYALMFIGPMDVLLASALVLLFVGSALVHIVRTCVRLVWQKKTEQGGAIELTVAWIILGLSATPDFATWLGFGRYFQGFMFANFGLGVFACIQGLVLSRSHTFALKAADQLNAELRLQIASRSESLFSVLTQVARAGDSENDTFQEGRLIDGRYRIGRVLGKGGMGTVYETIREPDGARMALKVANRADSQDLARIAREARVASSVSHPNIVSVRDVNVAPEGFLYLAMEYVDGPSLEEERHRFGQIAWALGVLSQVAEALLALHDQGISHRDLKPSNVLLSYRSHREVPLAKLVDFGISRIGSTETVTEDERPTSQFQFSEEHFFTDVSVGADGRAGAVGADTLEEHATSVLTSAQTQSALAAVFDVTVTGQISGTPRYMAPEIVLGETQRMESDIFSFGVLAYELLGQGYPFLSPPAIAYGANKAMASAKRLTQTPGQLTKTLAELFTRCVSVDWRERPASGDVVRALRGFDLGRSW